MKGSITPWVLALAVASCAHGQRNGNPAQVELVTSFDLPRVPETQELSGTYYDASTHTLFAVPDNSASIDRLSVSDDGRSFTVEPAIPLLGRPSPEWDGEAIAHGPDGAWWIVAVERSADVERFSASGAYLGRVNVPAHFSTPASTKMGVESLSFSPSGAHLFLTTEDALAIDGAIATNRSGTYLRILRRDMATGHDEERAYLTDPAADHAGATLGVSDVTALDETHVLVLERGFAEGFGNSARIYEASFDRGEDVSSVPSLGPGSPTLKKRLVVDLSALHAPGVKNPETEPNPLLGNYEGIALGPVRADGRRLLFVTSDDNASQAQISRIIVLAL